MQITAITMARVLAFLELEELNPTGKAYYPDIAAALVKKFNFQVFPAKPEDFNEQAGIQFLNGKFSEGTLDRVQIFSHGIVLDTRISTDVSEQVLIDTLRWASSELGLHYKEGMIKRRAYVSQVVFESKLEINKLNPILAVVGDRVTSGLARSMGRALNYETTGIIWNFDQTSAKLTPGPFTIERRAEASFADNKYFSAAPLSTTDHFQLLKELEESLL